MFQYFLLHLVYMRNNLKIGNFLNYTFLLSLYIMEMYPNYQTQITYPIDRNLCSGRSYFWFLYSEIMDCCNENTYKNVKIILS
jgi:hypothetical protein